MNEQDDIQNKLSSFSNLRKTQINLLVTCSLEPLLKAVPKFKSKKFNAEFILFISLTERISQPSLFPCVLNVGLMLIVGP